MKCVSVSKEPEIWRIELNDFEASLLGVTFQRLAQHYQLNVDELPTALQQHWKGNVGEPKDAAALQEEQHLLEVERQVWRSERLELVEKWLAAYLESGVGRPWALELDREQLESLLIVLNDRRLTLALEQGLDEALMEADPETVEDETLRQSLWEVHVLAIFQDRCLTALHGSIEPDNTGDNT